ncbi:unnamed protein product [Albugo candida]|uniref:Bromo domain-containing protein n=2 Tax=Albugo candida TaxID=65357 RepID=A0A024GE52_9STRA|nr:unnamed protein product [Albugo candida]|eukprot:CCI44805.1 unnamed protein product [Albugo candida]
MYRLLLLRLYLTVSNTVSSQMNYAEKCAYILDVLTSHEYSWPFLEPVDPVALNIPTYFDLVKNPMDLRTMRSKLEQNLYTNPSNFRNDMILMFENAIVFNMDDSRDNSVRTLAQKLLQISLDLYDNVFEEPRVKVPAPSTTSVDYRLSADKESSWMTSVVDELCASAKEQKLWEHWKKYSFVARTNRQKRMRHRLYGNVSQTPLT